MCYTHSMPFTSTFIFKFKNISYQAPGFSNICAWAKDAADTTGSGWQLVPQADTAGEEWVLVCKDSAVKLNKLHAVAPSTKPSNNKIKHNSGAHHHFSFCSRGEHWEYYQIQILVESPDGMKIGGPDTESSTRYINHINYNPYHPQPYLITNSICRCRYNSSLESTSPTLTGLDPYFFWQWQ